MAAPLRPDTPLATKVVPSPNQGDRRGQRPHLVILHYSGMETAAAAIDRLTDPIAEVSSHYVVLENGRILQLVSEAARAWHAGASSWRGQTDINSVSIGIEIVNRGHDGCGADGTLPPYPAGQIEAVAALCEDIAARWSIRPSGILAHSDVSPGRKRDPGEHFPWDDLHARGVGRWVPAAPDGDGPRFGPSDEGQPVRALQALFAHVGYGLDLTGVYDARTEAVVAAFQRHWRPQRCDGVTDPGTLATLKALLAAPD